MSASEHLASYLSHLNHKHVTSSASTNSQLIIAIQDGTLSANSAHLLTADTQTAGRGQRERSWQSPAGNVYLSLYHPVQMPVSGLLSLVIGVELAKMPVIQQLNEQLRAQGLVPIGVKWANDLGFYKSQPSNAKQTANEASNSHNALNIEQQIIYFNKLAGILIEPVWLAGQLVGVVMGVGLNVQATPALTAQTSEGMSYQALSLRDICQLLKPSEVYNDTKTAALKTSSELRASLPSLTELYQQIGQALIAALSCFERLTQDKINTQTTHINNFMQQFDTLDALAGLRLQVTQNHNGNPQLISGYACGIDTHGCLQLHQDNGKISALFTGRIDVTANVQNHTN
jgi:BirA family biotin operon repressor/biotin-[acetyl-CoA-carboxylase] ligase